MRAGVPSSLEVANCGWGQVRVGRTLFCFTGWQKGKSESKAPLPTLPTKDTHAGHTPPNPRGHLRQLAKPTLCARVRQRERRVVCGFPPREGCKHTEGKSSEMGISCPFCEWGDNSCRWVGDAYQCYKCEEYHYSCDDCGHQYQCSLDRCPECRRAELRQSALEAVQELEHDSSSDDSEADWEDLNVTDDEDEEEFQDRVDVRRVQNRRARRARHAERAKQEARRAKQEAQRAEQELRNQRERERKETVKRKTYDTARIPPSKRPRSGGGGEGSGGGGEGCVVM